MDHGCFNDMCKTDFFPKPVWPIDHKVTFENAFNLIRKIDDEMFIVYSTPVYIGWISPLYTKIPHSASHKREGSPLEPSIWFCMLAKPQIKLQVTVPHALFYSCKPYQHLNSHTQLYQNNLIVPISVSSSHSWIISINLYFYTIISDRISPTRFTR